MKQHLILVFPILLIYSFIYAEEQSVPKTSWDVWSVYGRVTDINGKGMVGVTVRSACGWGSLMSTGTTKTDAEGNYKLKFGPGYIPDDNKLESMGLQCAFIYAEKDEFYEKNLSRHGKYFMASKLPDFENDKRYTPDQIILPNKPQKIDFIMLPTASINGILLDEKGEPVTNYKFDIKGEELSPGAEVLKTITTSEDGEFYIEKVPCKSFWFEYTHVKEDGFHTEEIKSNTLTFDKAQLYEVKVIINKNKKEIRANIISKY